MQRVFFILTTLFVTACTTTSSTSAPPLVASPYCGCLVFSDDVKSIEDLNYSLKFRPDLLLRSWYRWGEPESNKSYSTRHELGTLAVKEGTGIGGGISLSYVNDRDLDSPAFNQSWLSVNLDGSLVAKKDRKFASLSSADFRSYLVGKLLGQVRAGVKEIHLGESNGEIHFDDWTLGLKGNTGFIQWLRKKYSKESALWWRESFGVLGLSIHLNRKVERANFLALAGKQKENFDREYGIPGSWEGKNIDDVSAFLSDLYKENMQSFLTELREKLTQAGFEVIPIDLWGFAEWMSKMTVQPDAYLSTPPDERWKLNWSTDLRFDLERNRGRIRSVMEWQMASVKPIPVIYMIDHSKPFDDFKKLPDSRQAEITRFFSDLTKEIGANFVFRSYSNDRNFLGPKTEEVIITACRQRKLTFCPKNQ